MLSVTGLNNRKMLKYFRTPYYILLLPDKKYKHSLYTSCTP
nr:MAG TPA: hypothetical protein [Caudoviricetes sp.]